MLKSMYAIGIRKAFRPNNAGGRGRWRKVGLSQASRNPPSQMQFWNDLIMTQEPYSTTVRVYSDTKDTLDDMKRRGESYDQVIQRLIREHNDNE